LLKNLKSEIDPRVVGKFTFGSTDAWDDDLLDSCYCEIEPITNFLQGSKELLVGAKGAGKSAIFRRLSERKEIFLNPKKLEQIIIPINEVMEYTAVRELLKKKLILNNSSEGNELFYFWEVYVLYRTLKHLKSKYPKIYTSLDGESEIFMKHFENEKEGFIDFLKGIKGVVGIKLDVTNPNIPMPDLYISAESVKTVKTKDTPLPLIKIDSIKMNICTQLNEFKSVVYVLVDNLDDFASREGFEAQKKVIQGLVETCKYYTKFPEIKIKASLRPELYEKLNFAKLGGRDKIEPRAIHIHWNDDDIRRFIGERLIINIGEYCTQKHKHIQVLVNEKELFRPNIQSKGIISACIQKVKDHFAKEIDIRDARTVDLQDKIYQDVISSVFPRHIKHLNSSGRVVGGLGLFNYFSSHFCFANKNATPRIYMRFLEKVFSVANDHYLKNEPELMKRDANGEYPLIKRDFILEAYNLLQEEARKNCISSVDYNPWRKKLAILFEKQNKRGNVTYKEIRNWLGGDDTSLQEFLAYCKHLGVVHCCNNNSPQSEKVYEFPILFQCVG